MKSTRWIQVVDALFLLVQGVIFVRLFTVHASGDNGFHSALHVAGQTILGFLVSAAALAFAAFTRKALNLQRWFGLVSLFTTVAWGLLFLLASVAV
jgi:uncharacterized membrane protein YidH (DUF202 family)